MGVDETQVLPKSENATQDPYASQPPRDNGIKEPMTVHTERRPTVSSRGGKDPEQEPPPRSRTPKNGRAQSGIDHITQEVVSVSPTPEEKENSLVHESEEQPIRESRRARESTPRPSQESAFDTLQQTCNKNTLPANKCNLFYSIIFV